MNLWEWGLVFGLGAVMLLMTWGRIWGSYQRYRRSIETMEAGYDQLNQEYQGLKTKAKADGDPMARFREDYYTYQQSTSDTESEK